MFTIDKKWKRLKCLLLIYICKIYNKNLKKNNYLFSTNII